ncbi:MAG: hypothetical protein IKD09_01960 [Lentisphaeria bacterium]|nr:hypothetical protein [Lentisphaeria bacterium]
MKIAVVNSNANNSLNAENYRQYFPFAEFFMEFFSDFPHEDLSFYSQLIDNLPIEAEAIILVANNVIEETTKADFFSDSNEIKRSMAMLHKRDWDLSRSSWTTQKFANKEAEKIFNARNIVYKKYGVNFRFIHRKGDNIVSWKQDIVKSLELCTKSQLPFDMVHSSLITYLSML